MSTLLLVIIIIIIIIVLYFIFKDETKEYFSNRCKIPEGTWKLSCDSATMVGPVLHAKCNDKPRSINLDECDPGNIAFESDILTCTPGSGFCNSQPACQIPKGSYLNNCINPSISESILSTTCTNTYGGTKEYKLDLQNCGEGDIKFVNGDNIIPEGKLTCSSGNGLC